MNDDLVAVLKELTRRRGLTPSQLAADMGVSPASVSRWLSGKQKPSFESCLKLAAYTDIPLERILSIVGHLLTLVDRKFAEWPDFREYAKVKYPRELDDDLITLIEDLIERRRRRNASNR